MSRATGSIVLPAPTGQTLRHALDAGLSGLARLNEEPLAEPAHVPEDDGVVPIQDLLYRGKAALARAREVGDAIKAAGLAPDPDALAGALDAGNWTATTVRASSVSQTEAAGPILNFFLERYVPAFRAEFDEFVTAIREKRQPAVGFADGRAALVLAEAAAESVATGKVVKVR